MTRKTWTRTVTADACVLHIIEWLRWFRHPGLAALRQIVQLGLSPDMHKAEWEDFDRAWKQRSEYDL
jgi:hypothetical protein